EQFYVFFPIILMLLWKFAKNYITSFFALSFLFSLQLANYGSANFPDANFFLLPARGWELLAGALLAKLEIEKGRINNSFLVELMPAVGLFLICNAIVFFDDQMPHPSFITLLPVIGTMLIIWFSKKGELVSDLLGSKLFVAVGLISYSFYLWHFPIFAFARIKEISLSAYGKVECILLALILSVLTYWLVEQPTRNKTKLRTKYFLTCLVPTFILLVGTQTYLFRTDSVGKSDNLHPLLQTGVRDFLEIDGRICHQRSVDDLCNVDTFKDAPYLINLGDSHASTLAPHLYKLSNTMGMNYLQLTGAPFYFNVNRGLGREQLNLFDKNHTPKWQKFITEYKFPPSSVFIFTSRMNVYLNGTYYDNGEGGIEFNAKGSFIGETLWSTNNKTVEENIFRTFKWIINQGHKVVLVYPIPETGFHVPMKIKSMLSAISASEASNLSNELIASHSFENYKSRSQKAFELFDKFPSNENVIRVYPATIFCDESSGRCYTHNDEFTYYCDDDHLSSAGANLLVKEIAKQLRMNHQPQAEN
uniref:acyltransferase family protein n=1 Tax=uncultured Gimesia sp. TaxID=1678688 RepID=UPI00261D16FA